MSQKDRPDLSEICQSQKPGRTLAVSEAISQALALARPLQDSEYLPLAEAEGRILARDIAAPMSLPPFDNSAMDGYAVRSADLLSPGPWQLRVTDLIAAGDPADCTLAPGEAARILTGAPIPPGADTVVMQERVTRAGNIIEISDKPCPGANIRRQGEDVAKGSVLLAAGTRLGFAQLPLLAAAGIHGLRVVRRLRIGMISTGSELREPGEALAPGQIYNSNRYFLRALLARPWIELRDFGIVRDDPAAIQGALHNAAQDCDVLITTGGVSVGERDHMLDVLKRESAELSVLKVAMRPGKPLTIGRIARTLYLGLPGNPFAAAVTLIHIGLPAIRRVAGLAATDGDTHLVRAAFSYQKRPGRAEFVPVRIVGTDADGLQRAEMIGRGSSASLTPFAAAHGLAELPGGHSSISEGDLLTYRPLSAI